MQKIISFFKTKKGQHVFFIGMLFLIIVISHFKIAFLHYVPKAPDHIQYKGASKVSMEYTEKENEKALWNSNIFSGMPNYMIALSKSVPFISDLRKITNHLVNWRILLLFTGGVGMYVLLLSLGFSSFIAFIGAFSFSFSPHFIGLIDIGHNTKFKAIMYIPWIIWSFRQLRKKPSLLNIGLACSLLIGQLFENHPQITYYTMLMLIIYWSIEIYYSFKNKQNKSLLIYGSLVLLVGIISAVSVADPYFYNIEYGAHTIRGGTGGLSSSYATSWSFHPAEILTFIFPAFFGNISPMYWGWMPFTQTTNYFGIILFILAIFGLFQWKRIREIKFLGITIFVTLIFSFGRHLPFLSKFLLKFFPLFNKFRVPAMILIITIFAFIILAMYGLSYIVRNYNKDSFKNKTSKIFITSIIIFILALSLQGLFNKLNYIKEGETARYSQSQLYQLKEMRYMELKKSVIASSFYFLLFATIIYLFSLKKLKPHTVLIVIAILIFIDLYTSTNIYLKNTVKENQIDNTHFKKSELDKVLLKDNSLYRIYPLGREFGNNNWAYYHQTIGGYHAAKLKRYQEILEHCLNYELNYKVPINWNILNMLNTKYIIFEQNLPFDNLNFIFYDKYEKMRLYENKEALPRAWFVNHITMIKDKEKIWEKLNSRNFDPKNIAIIEKPLTNIETPDSTQVKIEKWGLNSIDLNVYTNKNSFLVLSEIFYPAGWNAYIDNNKTEIYATNYILRGIKVPEGNHKISFKFEPKIYLLSKKLSIMGILTTIIFISFGSFFYLTKKNKEE